MRRIRFKFSPEKARAAIHWMVREKPGIDLHALLKACYFADRAHLNAFGRPIFGATYRAMKFGPVPLEIYEMAKGEPLWLADLGMDAYPWRLDGFRLRLVANSEPDISVLSESDVDALKEGLGRSTSMSFDARTSATHGADWQAAELGIMSYEDMIDDSPDKAELVGLLRETSRFMRL
ncbi:type II toxin-antitoxin system antitoxin SocA domain-containing protein [Rhodoplanes roseus]|uniref:Antitoxin SocA-like Panacea domain-containing protein n=1 Tax=Rhodoplanes roseus TaxID=29409 RepID=A0A327KUP5_9BRAD|nr:Panacea domain-containing protein [Rhodoplanes roseus]RAI42559.1 hypothetical protein CH341_18940 [Rhodoplanes roseus]